MVCTIDPNAQSTPCIPRQWADGKDVHEIFETADIDLEGLTPKKVFRIMRDKLNVSLSEENKDELIQKFANDAYPAIPEFLQDKPGYTVPYTRR